jgi:pimeloyl-ACP methyl ester carboxylesterase
VTGFFWFLLGLIGLTLGLHLAARLFYMPGAAKIFGQTPWLPSDWREPLEEGEAVEVAAAEGMRLRGTYLKTTAALRRGVIVGCHEFNGDRWNMLSYTDGLRRRGFDLFLFDFRNHGASDRTAGYEPTPWATTYEVADIRAVLDYLASRDDAPPQGVGLLGVGRGAMAALCVADDPRVKALVVDGVYPTERIQIHSLRMILARSIPWSGWLFRVPEIVLEPLARWVRLIVGWRRHCRFVSVQQAARRVRLPVLMIHGQCDPHVAVDLVFGLRDAMPAPARLWIVAGAKHTASIRVAADEYHQRVGQFFEEHLATELVCDLAHQPVPVRHADAASPAERQVPVVQGM